MLTRRQLMSNVSLSALGVGLPGRVFAGGLEQSPVSGKVIVVGGGLSGLSAALELASKGVEVEVIEAKPLLGGRASAMMTEADFGAQLVPMEPFVLPEKSHYVDQVLSRLGVLPALGTDFSKPTFQLEGRRLDSEELGGRLKLMAALWKRARAQGDRAIPFALRQGIRWNQSLDFDGAFDLIGGQSVAQWHTTGAPLTPWKAFREIFAPLIFNAPISDVDAASFALAEQFYDGQERGVRGLSGSAQHHIWKPIQAALEAMGVRFRLGVEVTDLSFSGGRVSGLTLGGFGAGTWLEEAPKGWTEIPRENASPIRVFRDAEGALKAFAGTPRFDSEQNLYVVEGGDGIHVEGEDKRSHLPADNVILACGAESSWALAGDVLGLKSPPRIRERVRAHFWMDTPLSPDLPTWVLPEAGHCVSANLAAPTQQNVWASEEGGCVVSLQSPFFGEADESRLDALYQEMVQIWPELTEVKVLRREITQWSVPVPEPGWAQQPPSKKEKMPGLVSAGEHLFQGENAHGFEAAARSGRVAANWALREMGLELAPVSPDRDKGIE